MLVYVKAGTSFDDDDGDGRATVDEMTQESMRRRWRCILITYRMESVSKMFVGMIDIHAFDIVNPTIEDVTLARCRSELKKVEVSLECGEK